VTCLRLSYMSAIMSQAFSSADWAPSLCLCCHDNCMVIFTEFVRLISSSRLLFSLMPLAQCCCVWPWNPLLTDIGALHVRKGMFFNPDPYVKVRIEPGNTETLPVLDHHYKEIRTTVCENTTEPEWSDEVREQSSHASFERKRIIYYLVYVDNIRRVWTSWYSPCTLGKLGLSMSI